MSESKQKCCSKGYIGMVAISGLVVGVVVAHTFFMCPEVSYPACYKEMVKQGFMPSERLKYNAEPTWGKDNFSVELSGPILCDYSARIALMVPEKGSNGVVRPVEKFSATVQFKDGSGLVQGIPIALLSEEQGSALTVAPLHEDDKEFNILGVLGEHYTQSLAVVPLEMPAK